jgi:mannitol-1-phosphate/altronate dehydrogenase
MRLMRVGELGAEVPVVVSDAGSSYDLRPVTDDIDGRFFAAGGLAAVRAALERSELPPYEIDGLRVGAPVARPTAVICIGQNYAAHAAESGAQPPAEPIIFFKHPNTVVGPADDVRVPPGSARTDWEVELAVVIGRTARYLASEDAALECVAGYTISNDVSERDFQIERSGGQWSKGKCSETFNPLGPWLLSADEVADPQDLQLSSWVNGDERQASTTADMIFSVAFLVHHLSQFLVLEPGDVINTGTPQGVALSGRFPYLQAGDVHVLAAQDHLYSVVTRTGEATSVRIVGSIHETLVAGEDPEAVLTRLVDPAVQVVTMTVTEKGYCAVPSSGALDVARPDVRHDIEHPARPATMPGFLVEAVARRRAAGVPPFTVAPCDNLRSNGPATRRVVTELAAHRGGDLADWIAATIAFPSSMVDRMVPTTTDADRVEVRELAGVTDGWPVTCEPFSQWVIEDVFPYGRPPWELAGAELVADVEPFEQAKLRILNGAHSAFAYLGLLAGYAEIADAARDHVLRPLVLGMLHDEVIPTLTPPAGLDLRGYAASVVDRFANRALGYTTAKVAADGSQKLPVRILGSVRDRLATGGSVARLALVFAAYTVCVLGPAAPSLAVDDPRLDELLGAGRQPAGRPADAVVRLLALTEVFGADLPAAPAFREAVDRHAGALWSGDVRGTVAAMGEEHR